MKSEVTVKKVDRFTPVEITLKCETEEDFLSLYHIFHFCSTSDGSDVIFKHISDTKKSDRNYINSTCYHLWGQLRGILKSNNKYLIEK